MKFTKEEIKRAVDNIENLPKRVEDNYIKRDREYYNEDERIMDYALVVDERDKKLKLVSNKYGHGSIQTSNNYFSFRYTLILGIKEVEVAMLETECNTKSRTITKDGLVENLQIAIERKYVPFEITSNEYITLINLIIKGYYQVITVEKQLLMTKKCDKDAYVDIQNTFNKIVNYLIKNNIIRYNKVSKSFIKEKDLTHEDLNKVVSMLMESSGMFTPQKREYVKFFKTAVKETEIRLYIEEDKVKRSEEPPSLENMRILSENKK